MFYEIAFLEESNKVSTTRYIICALKSFWSLIRTDWMTSYPFALKLYLPHLALDLSTWIQHSADLWSRLPGRASERYINSIFFFSVIIDAINISKSDCRALCMFWLDVGGEFSISCDSLLFSPKNGRVRFTSMNPKHFIRLK